MTTLHDIVLFLLSEIDSFGCQSLVDKSERGSKSSVYTIRSTFPKASMDAGDYDMKKFIFHVKRVISSTPGAYLDNIDVPKRNYITISGTRRFVGYKDNNIHIQITVI